MAYTTIDDPSAYFQTKLYTGNGGSLAVTFDGNSNLQPDFGWFKKRNSGENHALNNTSIGIQKFQVSNSTAVEQSESQGNTDANDIASYDTNGFTFSGGGGAYNQSSNTYVCWAWKGNGGTRTTFSEVGNNPAGGYQVNTTAGFSMVDYTGTGATGTVAHGLGAVPHAILIKCRNVAHDWCVYHHKNTSAPETDHLVLNEPSATLDQTAKFNDTAPTSTNITFEAGGGVNANDQTHIAYVFTSIQGYSKFGGYTGNGSTNGTFVYTGFKPAWLMAKRTDASKNWYMFNNKFSPHNVLGTTITANNNDAQSSENSGTYVDFLSNGFKWRQDFSHANASGGEHVYFAFAEHPFVSSKGVPVTAR